MPPEDEEFQDWDPDEPHYQDEPEIDPEEIEQNIRDQCEQEIMEDIKAGASHRISDEMEFNCITNMYATLFGIIGDDPTREGLRDTPERIARSYDEIFSGYSYKNEDIELLMTQFDGEHYNEMVVLENIEFYSMCEHHMLPFYGTAHVAYLPNQKIVGISKLARLVDIFSRRLQNQERITQQVTAALDEYVEPHGSACVLRAQHLCMGCRGVRKPHAIMSTSSLTGAFKDDPQTRSEFFSFVGNHR